MSKRLWVACAFLVTATVGCVVPCHKGYQKSLEHGADFALPSPCRNRVHVFMMHGLTPSTDCGLNALRLKLGDNGFAKVGTGELCHAGWVKGEIECIVKNDPEARFVLLGYDLGGATALSLARDLTAKGVGVDAVVLLDPVGCAPAPCGVYTLLIANGSSTAVVPHSARVVVPDATHFTLPAHPTTVAVLTDLLGDIAARNCEPEIEEVPVWTYPHAPEARRPPTERPSGEWDFLTARPGPTRAIGTHVVTQPTAPPAVPVATPAVPVAVKR